MRRFNKKIIFIILIILPIFISLFSFNYYYNEKQLVKNNTEKKYLYFHKNNITAEKNEINDENIIEEPVLEVSNDVMGEVADEYVNTEVVYEEPVIVEEQVAVPVTNAYYNEEAAYQVLALMNEVRRNNGLNELSMDYSLILIANVRSEEITRTWSHTRPDGTEWWTLYSTYGVYGKLGENLAYGQETAAEVIQAWMDSESHRANLLNPEFSKVGISVYIQDGVYYWSQEFLG